MSLENTNTGCPSLALFFKNMQGMFLSSASPPSLPENIKIMGGVALTAATGYFIYLQTRAIEYEPSSSQKLFSSLINPLAPSRASRYFSVSGKVAPSGSQLVVD